MNLGRLCQIILKSDKEISGHGHFAQHAIFAYHTVRQTPLVTLLPLRFPALHLIGAHRTVWEILAKIVIDLFDAIRTSKISLRRHSNLATERKKYSVLSNW